jgi:hypothetical protein
MLRGFTPDTMMGRYRADAEENRDPGQDINFLNA